MPTPTRWPNGANDANSRSQHYNWPVMDPARYTTYFDDFVKFTAADWTITKVGTGTTALSTATLPGGNLVITNSAAAPDSVYLDAVGPSFKYTSGKRLLFKARLKVDDATLAGIVMGLQETDTTPADVNNGIFFIKTAAATSLVGTTEASNVQSTVAAGTVVADTFFTCGWVYEPRAAVVMYYFNDVAVGSTPLTNMPTVVMTPSFGVLNGSAVARVMTVDYILASLER